MSCKALTSFYIEEDKCTGCMLCFKQCIPKAITGGKKKVHIIDQDICTGCGTCFDVCPSKFDAVKKFSGVLDGTPVPEEESAIG